MAADFDPLKAVGEELAGMVDVLAAIKRRERAAEEAMSEAEYELHAIRKVRGFAQAEVARLRDKRLKIEQAMGGSKQQ